MKKYILLLLTCLIFTTGCSFLNNEDSVNTATGTNNAIKLTNNISSTNHILSDGSIIVIAKNNNKEVVELEVEVEFYDGSGNYLGSESDYLSAFAPKTEAALAIDSNDRAYDNYKVYVDATSTSYTSVYDKIEIVHNNNGDEVVAQVKNNSNDTIEYVRTSIVYYQGDKVVGYDYDSDYDVQSGRSANLSYNYPYDRDYEDIKFDTYKIFVDEVYSSKNY